MFWDILLLSDYQRADNYAVSKRVKITTSG